MTYRAAVWHTSTKSPNRKAQRMAAKLEHIQNKCLRIVAGAYRTTPICSLETETFTLPIDLYLDSRLATFQKRLENSEVSQVIGNTYNWIKARIKSRRGHKSNRKTAINEQRESWNREQKEWFRQDQPTHQRFTEKQKVLAAWKDR
jgi:hypothetical protein